MAQIEFWIQIENHKWDICPSGKDRMTGVDVKDFQGGKPPVTVTLHSPVTGHTRSNVLMHQPVRDSEGEVTDALILRRYTANWAAPDDRKVNPWDINELDPTDNGTMGTIPGPVIEASVGDEVIVHFRNMDMRQHSIFKLAQPITQKGMSMQMAASAAMGGMSGMSMQKEESTQTAPAFTLEQREFLTKFGIRDLSLGVVPFPFFQFLPTLQRTHSLHTHGFAFAPQFDGAYPLTPPDPAQPVGAEATLWNGIGVTGGFKQGDRVPPGATFTYTWQTIGWPTTQGVWLYHDHSVCDTDNVALGAIGIVVIHPPDTDPVRDQDVDIREPNGQLDPAFLPQGSPTANPIRWNCFGFANNKQLAVLPHFIGFLNKEAVRMTEMEMNRAEAPAKSAMSGMKKGKDLPQAKAENPLMQVGDIQLQLNPDFTQILNICFPLYVTPPGKALFLQLYHEFANIGMCVNGRKYLGNTPTLLAGPTTKMKFGVVGMGSMAHTFHIHGHRWVIPGPSGTGNNALQFGGPMDTATSQFEDTRVFGPANSFFFSIDEGNSFMRAIVPIGEWHMHCHVLAHMMDGMMGSLLIVNGGELAPPFAPLPVGEPCPTMVMNQPEPTPQPNTTTVHVEDFQFNLANVTIKAGDTVNWVWSGNDHSTTSDTGVWDSGVHNQPHSFSKIFNTPGTFGYHCTQHGSPGSGMHGSVQVNP